MRKNSVVNFVLAKKIATAVMIFCQAVFLLPTGAHAQIVSTSLSDVKLSLQTNGSIPMYVTATTYVPSVRFEAYNASNVKVMEYVATSTNGMYYYANFHVANLAAGTYQVRAVALDANLTVIYATPFKPMAVTDTLPTTLSFLSPLAKTEVGGTVSLSVKCTDQAVSVQYYYQAISETSKHLLGTILKNNDGIFNFAWNSASVANGGYVVIAKAIKDGSVVATKEVYFSINNQPAGTETAEIATSTITDPVPTTTPYELPLSVWMKSAPSSTTAQRTLLAGTNVVADSVEFIIDGPNGIHQVYQGAYSNLTSNNNYSFVWDAQNFAPNTYSISAKAIKGSQIVVSEPIHITKLASFPSELTSSTSPRTVATTSEPLIVTKIDIGSGAIGGVASGTIPLFAKTTSNIIKVYFFLEKSGGPELLGQASYDSMKTYWIYKWDTTAMLDGQYNILATGYDAQESKFYSNLTLKISVNNKTAPTAYVVPKIVEPAGTTTPAEKVNIILNQTATATSTAPVTSAIKVAEPIKPVAGATTLTIKPTALPVASQQNPTSPALPARQENTSTTQVTVVDKPVIKTEQSVATGGACQEAGINDARQCELYRYANIANHACQEANISNKEECIALIRGKFGDPAVCQRISPERCDELFSQVIVNKYMPQKQVDVAGRALEGLIGKNIQFVNTQIGADASSGTQAIFIKEKNGSLPMEKSLESAILPVSPFAKKQDMIGVTVLAISQKKGQNESGINALLSVDSDYDGLSDDIEKRLGTDPYISDSDRDGFNDGDEVKSGHNPLGTGMLAEKLHPAEQALVNKVIFEQPKTSGIAAPDSLAVERVEISSKSSSTNKIKLTGRALPNQVLSMFIYSALPIIVTVTTDQSGNWSYELDKSLTNGKHEAYVVLNNEQGKIESKSAPFSFFVSEARAVSQDDLLKADINVYNQTDTMLWWYATAGFMLILFIIGLFFLYIRSKKTTTLS